MIVRVLFFSFLLLVSIVSNAQHLIGFHKSQIENEVRKYYPGFALDKDAINHTYKYLKFVNKFEESTLLVFLSPGDTSTATKLMCEFSTIEDVKAQLSKNYTDAGTDQWIFSVKGTVYMAKLKREEWFFTVFTSKKKD